MKLRRAATASGVLVSLLAVGLAASAWACTSLATLDVAAAPAKTGSNVAVAGSAFAAGTPVVLHWGSPSGPEVARAMPDSSGRISASVAVPDAKPGYHVLVATQRDADGKAVYGTPARASLAVAAPDGTVPATPVAPAPTRPAASPDSGLSVVTLALGAVGVVLLAAGLAGVSRPRSRRRPAAAPARLD